MGRKREDKTGVRWEAIAPGLSFCTEGRFYTYFRGSIRTVGGKVFTTSLQNHSACAVYIFDKIGELDWVSGLEAN